MLGSVIQAARDASAAEWLTCSAGEFGTVHVGGDTDLMSTYLGGGSAAIDAVVGDAEVEALAIAAGQSVTWEADRANPRVGSPSGLG